MSQFIYSVNKIIYKIATQSLKKLKPMDFRGQIKEVFGVDLPIKNGFGSSFETAVVIELDLKYDEKLNIQMEYLKYMGILRNIEWEKISQTLTDHKERTYDVIMIETTGKSGKVIINTLETHYFDVTEVFTKHLTDWLKNKEL